MQQLNLEAFYSLENIPPWGRHVFSEFSKDMISENRPFPCIFGVEGFKQGSLRFTFIESPTCPNAMEDLADALKLYLEEARGLGKNTSFVAFFKPEKKKTLEEYEKQFWGILQHLHQLDEKEWPQNIPADPDHHLWEFSFHDEPIFVVCNTPVHEKRASRKAATFMITFQPRWVFDGISGETQIGKLFQKTVRDRLEVYDSVPAHPSLNWYGKTETREWRQYFLMDDNNVETTKCPFHASLEKEKSNTEKVAYSFSSDFKEFKVERGVGGSLEKVTMELLPIKGTGYVEIQKDEPFKAHPTHTHPTNEVLHILDGSVSMEVGGDLITCQQGDRIYLPKDTVHGSLAGIDGCLYVIAVLK
ncbi:YqcI/YcgG family protein [Sutcliffiella horikoshii]|uniref:YqcI/YcgG family protein n=1 Tax=Sutcliffiella horikoshii TaxID=79883 RepID=UPI001653C6AF|nr:YqcI/YcgG family protein [Sutcliffiella horikoshii]